jgi:3-oxoacyl-[acyl-carrier protein] reductase
MDFSLKNRAVIVTGGSRGIGAAIVKQLASSGARVAFTYSSQEGAAHKILSELPGEGHFYFHCDVSQEKSVEESFGRAIDKLGGLWALVNNAGLTRDQLLMRLKIEDWDLVMNTNLRGCFLTTKAVSRTLMKQKSGSIVNIGSVIGLLGNAGQANYSASKAGLVGLTKSTALELASRGIRVNCIAPGYMRTEMTDVLSEEVKSKILEKIPLQHIGEASDVANAVEFLVSDRSRYITGITLSVNGGMYMN